VLIEWPLVTKKIVGEKGVVEKEAEKKSSVLNLLPRDKCFWRHKTRCL